MKQWILSTMFLAMKNMTRMLETAIRMRMTVAKIRRPEYRKHLSQTNIQAMLRMKLMERVTVTAGEAIRGLRYSLGEKKCIKH